MKKLFYCISLSVAILYVSCADTERYIAPDEPVVVVQPSYDEALTQWEATLPSNMFSETQEVVPTDTMAIDYDDYLENQDFKTSRVVTIKWNGEQVDIDNPQESKGVRVTANGGFVVIENLESEQGADDARGKMTYRMTGVSTNGQVKIYSNKKFMLNLDGLSLSCPNGPAISIQKKKRCFVYCSEGTENYLSDGETYASEAVLKPEEDEKGCLFSEGQLIFCGTGRLIVLANHQHGIASDEYVRVHSGCDIDVRRAPKDGIHAKQQYCQSGGLVRCYSNKDALQSDSLGIQLNGGYLYLCGERACTANGGGQITIIEPAKMCPISWGN